MALSGLTAFASLNNLEEHDPIRWLTLNFGNRNFKETATYAKKLLEDSNKTDEVHILARVYLSLCKAYEENAPVDETIGIFLDERESLIIECKDADMKTLIYQMLISFIIWQPNRVYLPLLASINISEKIII